MTGPNVHVRNRMVLMIWVIEEWNDKYSLVGNGGTNMEGSGRIPLCGPW